MVELRFTQGEVGFCHTFQFPACQSFTGITGSRLVIEDPQSSCCPELDTTCNLTLCATCKTVVWNAVACTTCYTGRFEGILHLTGCMIILKTTVFPVTVTPSKV